MPPSKRLMLPSWIVSAIVHGVVLLAIGLMWQFAPQGVAEEPGRSAGIVLRKHTPQGDVFQDANDTFSDDGGGATGFNSTPLAEQPAEALPAADLQGLIPEPPTIGSSGLGGTVPGVEGDPTAGQGNGNGPLTGGKTRTSIYGIPGEGNKFVYVFDRSESMYGRQLESAKAELIGSLEHLERLNQFAIIFYNNGQSAFPAKRLAFGNDAGRKQARSYIGGITATGATNHFPALMKAVQLSPDVIFLLTDGEQHNDPTYDELRRIRTANSGTQIHVIQFVLGGVSTRGNALVQLARENGGKHKYINTQKFK
jgi:hypothetical protein